MITQLFYLMGRTSNARQTLIETAIELMGRRGYTDVGVGELCRQAGVKPGSFYYFFDSKAHLAVAALEAIWQYAQDNVLSPAAEADDPVERLDRFVTLMQQAHAQTYERTGQVYGCPFGNLSGELLALDPTIQNKLSEIFARYYAYFEAILRDIHAQGRANIDDIPRKAKSLFALIEGMQMLAHTHNDPTLLTALTPDVRALIAT